MTPRTVGLINLHSGSQVRICRSDGVSRFGSVSVQRSIERRHGNRPFQRALRNICPGVNEAQPDPQELDEKYDDNGCNESKQEPAHGKSSLFDVNVDKSRTNASALTASLGIKTILAKSRPILFAVIGRKSRGIFAGRVHPVHWDTFRRSLGQLDA
jgi:hypothetical protein